MFRYLIAGCFIDTHTFRTAVDVQAAKLTAQKLSEYGLKGEERHDTTTIKEEEEEVEENEDGNEQESNDVKETVEEKKTETPKPETNLSNLSDLEELLFCRSPNQIKVDFFPF